MAVEFEAWPKIPRWNREVVITEKIDGTNACILIEPLAGLDRWSEGDGTLRMLFEPDDSRKLAIVDDLVVFAQSRTRFITPDADNAGFARWVQENAKGIVELLGPGRHFGEWYGAGIQRRYGLDHKRFALFNVQRWSDLANNNVLSEELCIDVVPVLGRLASPGTERVELALERLEEQGSALVPGFMKPEGVVLYHSAAKQTFKILLENDDVAKGAVAA